MNVLGSGSVVLFAGVGGSLPVNPVNASSFDYQRSTYHGQAAVLLPSTNQAFQLRCQSAGVPTCLLHIAVQGASVAPASFIITAANAGSVVYLTQGTGTSELSAGSADGRSVTHCWPSCATGPPALLVLHVCWHAWSGLCRRDYHRHRRDGWPTQVLRVPEQHELVQPQDHSDAHWGFVRPACICCAHPPCHVSMSFKVLVRASSHVTTNPRSPTIRVTQGVVWPPSPHCGLSYFIPPRTTHPLHSHSHTHTHTPYTHTSPCL